MPTKRLRDYSNKCIKKGTIGERKNIEKNKDNLKKNVRYFV